MKTTTSVHHSFPVFSILFTLIGSGLLGLFIGVGYLISVQPKAVSAGDFVEEQKELAPFNGLSSHFNNRMIYYRSSGFSQNSKALDKKLYTSTSNQIEVTATELNAWANANLYSANTTGKNEEGKSSSISLIPQTPIFQITNHQLHIAYPTKVKAWGEKMDLMFLASGDFSNQPGGPQWITKRLCINSAPLPFKQQIYKIVKPRLLKAISENQEAEKLQSAWKRIETINIGDAALNLVRK